MRLLDLQEAHNRSSLSAGPEGTSGEIIKPEEVAATAVPEFWYAEKLSSLHTSFTKNRSKAPRGPELPKLSPELLNGRA